MHNIVIMALPDEAPEFAHNENVFFTGIGKVNAASKTAELIERYNPEHIVNFGTAGGITVGPGLYQVTKFVQRDMQCVVMGAKPGETPYETTPVILDLGGSGLTCSTGDSFVTDPIMEIPADLVDMEAYAIAKICWKHNIRFSCYKFVSDQANSNACQDWNQMISAGQSYYKAKLQELRFI